MLFMMRRVCFIKSCRPRAMQIGNIIKNSRSPSSSSVQWRASARRPGPCQTPPLLPMCWATCYPQFQARTALLSMQLERIHKECKMVFQGTPWPIMNENSVLVQLPFVCWVNYLPSMVHMEPKRQKHLPNCLPMLLLEPWWQWETFQRSFRTVQLLPYKWWPFQGEQKPGRRQYFVLHKDICWLVFPYFSTCSLILANQQSTNECTYACAHMG